MSRSWDVVVVGARVAGAATALLLARAGVRVLCVDRARYGSDTVSTHALMRGGVYQLTRWGLLDAVVEAGTPPVSRTVFHFGDEQVPIAITPAAGVDALYAPRRTVLDRILVDAAREAGAAVEFGTTLSGLLRDGSGAVTGVALRNRTGRSWHERAGLVVGADGRRSTVAEAVSAPVEVAGRTPSDFLYGYWAGVEACGYEWFYRSGVTAGAIPTNDGLTCVFLGASPERAERLVRAHGGAGAFDRLAVHSGVGIPLCGARLTGSLRYVRGQAGALRRSWGVGWALVGDAGSWKDPLSTHGITAALRDAELLARAVTVAPEPGPAQLDALAAYQLARDRLAAPMLRLTDSVAGYRWDLPAVRRLLLDLSGTMTDELALLRTLAADPLVSG